MVRFSIWLCSSLKAMKGLTFDDHCTTCFQAVDVTQLSEVLATAVVLQYHRYNFLKGVLDLREIAFLFLGSRKLMVSYMAITAFAYALTSTRSGT